MLKYQRATQSLEMSPNVEIQKHLSHVEDADFFQLCNSHYQKVYFKAFSLAGLHVDGPQVSPAPSHSTPRQGFRLGMCFGRAWYKHWKIVLRMCVKHARKGFSLRSSDSIG